MVQNRHVKVMAEPVPTASAQYTRRITGPIQRGAVCRIIRSRTGNPPPLPPPANTLHTRCCPPLPVTSHRVTRTLYALCVACGDSSRNSHLASHPTANSADAVDCAKVTVRTQKEPGEF